MNKKQLKVTLSGILLAAALSACGKVPEGYQGKYQDTATGAKLTLESTSGAINLSSGREIKGDFSKLEFDGLIEGKPGIYLRTLSTDDKMNEVFFLFPRKETRKEEAGFVWLNAEILYSRMSADQKEKVQQLKMIHCEDGVLMLDLPTKTWNGGCPTGATQYDFVRKE